MAIELALGSVEVYLLSAVQLKDVRDSPFSCVQRDCDFCPRDCSIAGVFVRGKPRAMCSYEDKRKKPEATWSKNPYTSRVEPGPL